MVHVLAKKTKLYSYFNLGTIFPFQLKSSRVDDKHNYSAESHLKQPRHYVIYTVLGSGC